MPLPSCTVNGDLPPGIRCSTLAEVLARFDAGTFVLDMIYNPVQTQLLRQARNLGLRAANGLSMLLHQGALAFTLWTGQPAPLEIMRSTLL